MPSLQQLEEFTSSFANIGSETNSLAVGQYSRANFPLPDNEPPSPFPEDIAGIPETESGLSDFDFSAFLNPPTSDIPPDIPPDIPASPETEVAEFPPDMSGFGDSGFAEQPPNGTEETGDFGIPADFGDFGLPEDTPEAPSELLSEVPPESSAEMPEEISAEEAAGTGEDSGEDAGEIPADLLSGFADDLESDGLPVNETFAVPGEDDSLPDFSTIDLSNAMDLRNEESPVESVEESVEGFGETAAETEDVPEAESLAADDLVQGSLSPDDAPVSDGFEPPAFSDTAGEQDVAFPDISDISADTGNEEIGEALPVLEEEGLSPEAGDESGFPAEFPSEFPAEDDIGINITESGGPESVAENGVESDGVENGDAFDTFNPAGESWGLPGDASLETPDFDAPADDLSGSSFSLEGFDDFGSPETGAPGPQADMASEDVEEIHLGED
ncbi:MAG: hypothetical protein LBP69_01090, partial [Treponema sp.]|nr:hypothetical protein [Treponema sp.]